tara:strand:+ start:551 stop:844 length:294 start_codon:yes stop_codon:yes gene_type:complete
MLGLTTTALALSLPLPNARDLYRKKIDVKIKVYHNILDSPLSWREREMAFDALSTLYYEQYVLDNVPDADYFPPLDLSALDSNNDTEVDYTWFDLDH